MTSATLKNIILKKAFQTLIFIFSIFYLNSQEPLSSFNTKLAFPNQVEPLAIVDLNNNTNFVYVLNDKITHVRHNTDIGGHFKKEYPRFLNAFPRLQGLCADIDGSVNLFFSNYRGDGFFLMSLNDRDEKVYVKQFILEFDSKERFLKTLNYDNKFQMLTYVKGASVLKRYIFTKDKVKTIVYNLSDKLFYNKYGNEVPLSNILASKDDCSVIEPNIPLSLEIVSKKVKLYPKKDELLISINHRKGGTRIIRLSSNDDSSLSNFHKADAHTLENNKIKKSNSFILGDTLYYLSVTKDNLSFLIDNIKTKERLKVLSFGKNDSIVFKNGQIYEQGPVTTSPFSSRSVSNRKVVESTKKFLQSLSKSNIGIHAFYRNNIIDITIGGINSNETTGSNIISSTTTVTKNVGDGQIEINTSSTMPLKYSFYSYIGSSSIFFKSLLDRSTFEHIVNDSPNVINNVFDRISMRSRYLKNSVLKKKLAIETIFKMNDFFVYGYYNKKKKTYTLVKFNIF